MKKIENKTLRYGGYASLITIIVIAITIVFNLIVGDLNIKFDTTSEGLFSLSQTTQDMVKNLDEPVTVYMICTTGDENPIFKEILTRYGKLSSNLKIAYKDPVVYPGFVNKYIDGNTVKRIPDNSLIVQNDATEKYKVLLQSELYTTTTSQETNQTEIDSYTIENKLTSAISYVSTAIDNTAYVTTGHSEADMPTLLSDSFSTLNLEKTSINLLTEDLGDPASSILVILSPHKDFSDDETSKVIDFLDAGGKAFITTDIDVPELTNFSKILAYYGLKYDVGIAVESDSNHMLPSSPICLIPSLNSHAITSSIISSKVPLLLPYCQGLSTLNERRSSIEITPLLTTSDSGYLKADLTAEDLTKQTGDSDGPIVLAAAAEDTNTLDPSNPINTRVVVIANSYFMQETSGSSANGTFLQNTFSWLKNSQDTYSIANKALNDYSLSIQSTSTVIIYGIITIILLPVIVMIFGIIVWTKRRHL